MKNIESLKMKLCKYGTPQIVKEGVVFTVLITGAGLTSSKSVMDLQELILSCAGDKFPIIEAFKNDENFFCLILKPKLQ